MRFCHLRHLTALFLLLCATAAIRAQLPSDNLAWKDRCRMLTALNHAIQSGGIAPMLVSATHDIPAAQFITFGFDRSLSGNHNVACTLFYMAAISQRTANHGKSTRASLNDTILGLDESRLARGHRLTMSQRMKREDLKLHQLSARPLTSAQLEAILAASDTMPISAAPPPKLP